MIIFYVTEMSLHDPLVNPLRVVSYLSQMCTWPWHSSKLRHMAVLRDCESVYQFFLLSIPPSCEPDTASPPGWAIWLCKESVCLPLLLASYPSQPRTAVNLTLAMFLVEAYGCARRLCVSHFLLAIPLRCEPDTGNPPSWAIWYAYWLQRTRDPRQ